MTYRIAGQRITAPDAGGHGLDMSNGQDWLVEDCIIDLSAYPLGQMDEAVGITWGSSATFRRCIIRGAGKLVLCGAGDVEAVPKESGKTVRFEHCVLENFGRRAPEVQSGMRVVLQECLIRNWGLQERFDIRSFAAWAHHGGSILAVNCVFDQPRFWCGLRIMVLDWLAHICQAWNDEGLRGLLRPANWLPGVCRGLVATAGGQVRAEHCHSTRWWIRLENHHAPMSASQARMLTQQLEDLTSI